MPKDMKTLKEINLDNLVSATKTETITVGSTVFSTSEDGLTTTITSNYEPLQSDFTNEFGNILTGTFSDVITITTEDLNLDAITTSTLTESPTITINSLPEVDTD